MLEESRSVRQTENLASKMAVEPKEEDNQPKAQPGLEVNYLADTERQLTSTLGRKVIIKDNSKKGKIELEYYGSDDREALIDALLKFGKSKGGHE